MVNIETLKQQLDTQGLVDEQTFEKARKEAERRSIPIDTALIEQGAIDELKCGIVMAEMYGLPFVNLREKALDPNVVRQIPEALARNKRLVLYEIRNGKGYLSMHNPQDPETVNAISRRLNLPIEISFTTDKGINEALRHYQRGISEEFEHMIREHVARIDKENQEATQKKGIRSRFRSASGDGTANEVPVAKMVDSIITHAYQHRASDIHFEPIEQGAALRFRIDGILHDILPMPQSVYGYIVARVKIMSNMRTDEHQKAQDGKLRLNVSDEDLDVRVSILPTVYGEKIVMRLLPRTQQSFTLDDLGMRKEDLRRMRNAILRPHGMILATGPTGSGKTTTLYAILKTLNTREVNITTVEDPVEYMLDGVNQVQIKPQAGLTFADGLRSMLRQDPDIVMVGEIRDEETAEIAVNAALTGHLVLSTLHTNDAATAAPRLLDMGVKPFLVASSLSIAVAQRLVRKICKRCMRTEPLGLEQRTLLVDLLPEDSPLRDEIKRRTRVTRGVGCTFCGGTGYAGRIGIYEVLQIDEEVQACISAEESADSISSQARKAGMTFMVEDGVEKIFTGVTTVEEVMRVTRV